MADSNSQCIVPLTCEELEIMRSVFDASSRIDLVVPQDINPQKLWDTLQACCNVAGRVSSAGNKIRPIIGRLLVVLKKYPEVYVERGYNTYEDFISRGMDELFGISRTEAYEWRKVAERLSSVSIEDLEKMGTVKAQTLARLTGDGDQNFDRLFKIAMDEGKSKNDIIAENASIKGLSPEETDLTNITITVTRQTADEWKKFFKSPMVQAYVGDGTNPATEGLVFSKMLAEAQGEWEAQGAAILEAGRHEAIR